MNQRGGICLNMLSQSHNTLLTSHPTCCMNAPVIPVIHTRTENPSGGRGAHSPKISVQTHHIPVTQKSKQNEAGLFEQHEPGQRGEDQSPEDFIT